MWFGKSKSPNKPEEKLGSKKNPQVSISTTISEMNYTERYEYACSLVKLFLDREELTEKNAQPGYVGIFRETSVMYTIFTMDFRLLSNSDVATTVVRQLTLNEENKSSNMILVRFYNVFYDICAALGTDFIQELSKNVAGSLLLTAGLTDTEQIAPTKAHLAATLAAVPIILLFVIGAKDYATRFITHQSLNAQHQLTQKIVRTTQKQEKPQTSGTAS